MAARHVFGELLLFVLFLILLRPFHIKETPYCKIDLPTQKLWHFHAGKVISIAQYDVPYSRIRHALVNSSTMLNSKQVAVLLRHLKFVVFAELNISVCLLLCGDIECNPGPDCIDYSTLQLPAKGLRFGHWNINYLNTTKLEEIKLHILSPSGEKKLDILALTETFFNDSTPQELYHIPGFDLLRKDRKSCEVSCGGGILMYVNNELNIKRRTDLEESDLEVLWLQVCPFKSKRNILIAAIYRPPNVKCEVDEKLAENIERVHMLNSETILIGDFNIDFLNCSYKKQRLVKALKDSKFTQLVTTVTRPASNSCLDQGCQIACIN